MASFLKSPGKGAAKRAEARANDQRQKALEEAAKEQAAAERGIRARRSGRALLRFSETLG